MSCTFGNSCFLYLATKCTSLQQYAARCWLDMNKSVQMHTDIAFFIHYSTSKLLEKLFTPRTCGEDVVFDEYFLLSSGFYESHFRGQTTNKEGSMLAIVLNRSPDFLMIDFPGNSSFRKKPGDGQCYLQMLIAAFCMITSAGLGI